jgi:hypothetical protein
VEQKKKKKMLSPTCFSDTVENIRAVEWREGQPMMAHLCAPLYALLSSFEEKEMEPPCNIKEFCAFWERKVSEREEGEVLMEEENEKDFAFMKTEAMRKVELDAKMLASGGFMA